MGNTPSKEAPREAFNKTNKLTKPRTNPTSNLLSTVAPAASSRRSSQSLPAITNNPLAAVVQSDIIAVEHDRPTKKATKRRSRLSIFRSKSSQLNIGLEEQKLGTEANQLQPDVSNPISGWEATNADVQDGNYHLYNERREAQR